MKGRNHGGTLGFVAAVTMTIILIGAAFFFFARMLGGARELQHVTDAGNLNVAKQSLKLPTVNLFGSAPYDLTGLRLAQCQKNFSELKDKATGQINLQVFNRLVGQATLVAINASSDNYPGKPSDMGIQNAQTLIDLIANPAQGIGTILANKLKSDSIMDDHFVSLASLAPMRMLNPGGPAASVVSANKNVSYMVRGLATNMRISANAIPDEYKNFIDPSFLNKHTVDKNGVKYLKGYSLVDIPVTTHPLIKSVTNASTYPLMGTSLRPGEKPHLVALSDFLKLQASPLPAAGQPAESRVPPNAFKSHGTSAELKSSKLVETLACAIAGSITSAAVYPVSIPCGYIVVANGNGFTPVSTPGAVTVDGYAAGLTGHQFPTSSGDIFSEILMDPPGSQGGGGLYVAEGLPGYPDAICRSANILFTIQQWKQDHPGKPVPPNMANQIDGPPPKQATANGMKPNGYLFKCTNHNTPGDPKCGKNFENMLITYGYDMPGGGGGTELTGLTAKANLKSQIMFSRPPGTPAHVSGLSPGVCTGLDHFNLSGLKPSNPIKFGQPGTINNLLNQFIAFPSTKVQATTIYNQLLTKIAQIKPDVSPSEIAGILNTHVPMGAIMYIWMDGNRNLKFTDASGLPPWIDAGQVLPDGTTTAAVAYQPHMDGVFVNLEGEQNYPHPWDCVPPTDGPGSDQAIWTRSSGFNCLQGVLRFMDCVTASGTWDCPC